MSSLRNAPALVFFDIDGTLLNEQKKVPESAASAIRQLRRNGHLAFLNTGRSFAGITQDILDVGFDGIIAGCGTWISYQDQLLLNVTIDQKILDELLPVLESNAIDTWLEGPDHVYFESFRPHQNIAAFIDMFAEFPGVVQDWHQVPVSANKFCYMLRPESQLETALAIIQKHFTIINHQPEPISEILIRGYSKATGMVFLLEHLGMAQEQTFAFGDSLNDIDMLTFAEHGIAMGGSRHHVRRVSDHTTGTAAENGIADALRHYGLI